MAAATTVNEVATESASNSLFSKETLMSFLPLILIFGIFYILLIRPQVAKQKEHAKMLGGVKKGDKVIVAGGIIAKIIKIVDDQTLLVEMSKGVAVEVLKSSVISILDSGKGQK